MMMFGSMARPKTHGTSWKGPQAPQQVRWLSVRKALQCHHQALKKAIHLTHSVIHAKLVKIMMAKT